MNIKVDDEIIVNVVNVSDAGLKVTNNIYNGVVRVIDLYWDTHGALEKMYNDYKCSDNISVKVVAVDNHRFRGSVKDLFPEKNPWLNPEIYVVGAKFEGMVFKETDFGYFIKLDTGALSLLKKEKNGIIKYKEEDSIVVTIESVDRALEKLTVTISGSA
ncbi:hypothetical protein N9J26_00590 [bacterium]|nr:hypothetical protein [bacterium]